MSSLEGLKARQLVAAWKGLEQNRLKARQLVNRAAWKQPRAKPAESSSTSEPAAWKGLEQNRLKSRQLVNHIHEKTVRVAVENSNTLQIGPN